MTAKSLRLALLSSAMASLGGATLLATYSLGREPPAVLDAADATAFPICSSLRAADPGLRFPVVPMLRYAQTEVSKEAQAAKPAPEFVNSDPPLWDGLSSVTYKVTTANAEAQKYFDQGLRMAYAFNHGEAQRAFRKGQKLVPDCAMCFWGEALVLGPNINLPMMEEVVAPAYAAAQKAKALIAKAAPHEKALIEALALRYAAEPPKDRAPLDRAYADAMAKVAAAFSDDQNIAVLYAEAVMDLSP